MPHWHPVYTFFGTNVSFMPHWQKPDNACPGVYLDCTRLTAIVDAAAAAPLPVKACPRPGVLVAPCGKEPPPLVLPKAVPKPKPPALGVPVGKGPPFKAAPACVLEMLALDLAGAAAPLAGVPKAAAAKGPPAHLMQENVVRPVAARPESFEGFGRRSRSACRCGKSGGSSG